MPGIERRTRILAGIRPGNIPYNDIIAAQEPVIVKGLALDWPLVRQGLASPESAMEYLLSFYSGQKVVGYTGKPEINGRFFYNDDVTTLNFEAERVELGDYLGRIRTHLHNDTAPSFYVGSTDVDTYLPGLRGENDLKLEHQVFRTNPPLVSIWIGNRTTASAHQDMSNNIACCMVGRRRFILFPPDQVHNLYPGPLELTPGGQAVSMVDFHAPDFERYPRFRDALAAGQIADLEPGDVLFYPAMWWHQVEALDAFNVMINYWWSTAPAFMDTPMNTLLHGLLSLRDRPDAEKHAWKSLFDYYVFGPAETAGAHLPGHARGILGPMDDAKARRLRALLLNRINR